MHPNELKKLQKYKRRIEDRNIHITNLYNKIGSINDEIEHLMRINARDEDHIEEIEHKLKQIQWKS